MEKRLQLKRGLKTQMPQLAVGELGFATDEGRLYLGNNGGNIAMARDDHTHTPTQVGLGNVNNTADANKSVNYANSAGGAPWDGVSGKPATFPPAYHNHNGVYEPVFTKNDAFNKNFGTAAGTVCQGNDSRLADIFDVVIRTQAEFDALIASPNWLGAVSVCFIGDGGTLKFTKSGGDGVKIPPTVKQIQGMNSATIEVPKSSSNYALWYETLPTTDDYLIDGMIVHIGDNAGGAFYSCTNLTNCTGNGAGISAFRCCTNLTNCTGNGGDSTAFWSCSRLTNCTGSGGMGGAFWSCSQLTNCTGSGGGSNGAFRSCSQLTNCTGSSVRSGGAFWCCSQLTNCTGSGGEYCFYDCHYLNGCKQGNTAPTKAFLGGANTHVDTATVAAT